MTAHHQRGARKKVDARAGIRNRRRITRSRKGSANGRGSERNEAGNAGAAARATASASDGTMDGMADGQEKIRTKPTKPSEQCPLLARAYNYHIIGGMNEESQQVELKL